MSAEQKAFIASVILSRVPKDYPQFGLNGQRWTIRLVVQFVAGSLLTGVSKSTIQRYLHELGLSFQKARKRLAKADEVERWCYLMLFRALYAECCAGQRTLIYIDECHVHQDVDRGHSWWRVGQRYEVPSSSPGLDAKINWYGAYDFSNGRVLIVDAATCNGSATATFLAHLKSWLGDCPCPTIIWDNSSVHTARIARQAAQQLGFVVIFLPRYSPDFNPIEELWRWLREEVTYCYCFATRDELWDACIEFIDRINGSPERIIQRLWPRFGLSENADEDPTLDDPDPDEIERCRQMFTQPRTRPRRPRRRHPQPHQETATIT